MEQLKLNLPKIYYIFRLVPKVIKSSQFKVMTLTLFYRKKVKAMKLTFRFIDFNFPENNDFPRISVYITSL